MPGIETFEPDLTDNNNGLDKSPNFFFEIFSIILISFFTCWTSFFGISKQVKITKRQWNSISCL